MISLSDEGIREAVKKLDRQVKEIKEEVFRISWFMRGGVSSEDLFWRYSVEDREIMSKIIKTNVENTKNSKLPLL